MTVIQRDSLLRCCSLSGIYAHTFRLVDKPSVGNWRFVNAGINASKDVIAAIVCGHSTASLLKYLFNSEGCQNGLRYRSAFASRTTTTMENCFRYLEFWSLGDEDPELKSQSPQYRTPYFNQEYDFF